MSGSGLFRETLAQLFWSRGLVRTDEKIARRDAEFAQVTAYSKD
jgi:hypothetical protein